MKILKLILVLSLLMPAQGLFAQTLKVEERTMKNEEGVGVLCWTAILDQAPDFCKDTYDDFMKEFFKAKTDKRGKNILIAEKVLIPEISSLRLDQRALFTIETGGTAMSFSFSPGYDVHFGKDLYAEEFAKAESFVHGYVRFHYKAFYGESLKTVMAKLETAEEEITSNTKKIDRNSKSIADNSKSGSSDAKVKNDKLQREIDSLTAAISRRRDEISLLEDEAAKLKTILEKVEKFR